MLDADFVILLAFFIEDLDDGDAAPGEHGVAVSAGVTAAALVAVERREFARDREQIDGLLDHPPTVFDLLAGLVIGDAEEVMSRGVKGIAVGVEQRAVAIAVPGNVRMAMHVAADGPVGLAAGFGAIVAQTRRIGGFIGVDIHGAD